MGNNGVKPLSDNEINMFAAATNFKKEKILKIYESFNTMSNREKGRLYPNDCTSLFAMFYPGKNSGELIKLMFEAFDTDNNGFLDFREFLIGLALLESRANNPDDFSRFFFKIGDRDKSKSVDPKELKKLIKLVIDSSSEIDNERRSEAERKQLDAEIENMVLYAFQNFDNSKKGYLDENEFIEFFKVFGMKKK